MHCGFQDGAFRTVRDALRFDPTDENPVSFRNRFDLEKVGRFLFL